MAEGLRMVHLRTVPDSWHAKVLAARLGCEGIVTQLRGSVSGPYPFGSVAVLVEADQAELAADLLLADEVEAAFQWPAPNAKLRVSGASLGEPGPDDLLCSDDIFAAHGIAIYSDGEDFPRHRFSRQRRALAASAALLLAGGPLLAHFIG
jgi:hypothetical protein